MTRLLGFESLPWEAVPITPIERVFQRLEALERVGHPSLALLIHEGRLIFEQFGCERVLDIGKAWKARTGGSLPLGMNVVRRDLPLERRQALSRLFIASCAWAQEHRDEFLDEAAKEGSPFQTRLTRAELSNYLNLYANDTTRDVLPDDALSFEKLLHEAGRAGFYENGEPIPCDWV